MVFKNHLSLLEEIVSLVAIALWHITDTTDVANAPLKKLLFHTAENEFSVFMSNMSRYIQRRAINRIFSHGRIKKMHHIEM